MHEKATRERKREKVIDVANLDIFPFVDPDDYVEKRDLKTRVKKRTR